MAAELVGGAFLSASLQVLFDRLASRDIVDYLRGKKVNHRLLKKLKIMLLSVTAVLSDAEEKQIRNPIVKEWLDELEDAAYDADDLLDEITTDALQFKLEAARSRNDASKVSDIGLPISLNRYDLEMETKIEEILESLEFIAKQKDVLGLKEGVGEKPSTRIPTTSLVEETEVYGRDVDKEALLKLLLTCHDVGSNKLCVIPIVGMGGVGKTTLAQLVYNNEEINDYFDVKSWVCVSEEFDICRVTRTILRAVTPHSYDNKELDSLQIRLKEELMGKRFLIVLDDVWNENYINWEIISKPFKHGDRGSKIIVTTRSESVARIMGTVPNHYLDHLNDEDCWQLFAKHAFDNGDFSSHPTLETIGREVIVKKCKGLPLAVKTLGGLLHSNLEVGEWERISKSEIWDFSDNESNILPALRLSYHYLPSYLKRCFAFCSIFPKDYEFKRQELVLLWMAENFLQQSKRSKRMEDIGDEYFNELVSRSLFQRSSSAKECCFVMHDLVHDLAKYVSREYCFTLEDGNSEEIVMKTRHLAIVGPVSSKRFDSISEAIHLRTFLPLSISSFDLLSHEEVNHVILKMRYLRVLRLSGCKFLQHFPESVGDMRHLRYLDLSRSSIKTLPESVSRLCNLQTLNLSKCCNLTKLPKDLHHVINLRHLDISESNKVEMPRHISKLKSLQTLSTFIVGKDKGTKITELRELSDLQGTVSLMNLQNVDSSKDSLEANLMNKKCLEALMVSWTGDTDDSKHDRDVLDGLLPHTNLKKLDICGYGGTRFPNWLGDHSFFNIMYIKLSRCKYCNCLPPLGQLPSLQTLHIERLDGVVTVGAEFYGNGSSAIKPFASLEILHFHSMSAWTEWFQMQIGGGGGVFPKLQQLKISDCNNLSTLGLPHCLPSLTSLTIYTCQNLVSSLPRTPNLRKLELEECEKLHLQELPQTVESIRIGGGHGVESLIEALRKSQTCLLQSLHICNCSSSITFPSGCLPSTLKELEIKNCKKLEFPLHHSLKTSIEKVDISNSFSLLESFPIDFFPKLNILDIKWQESLESLTVSDGLCHDLMSLSYLGISNCPKFISFPQVGFCATSLTRLSIYTCKILKALPEQMNNLLPSLHYLGIVNCPELESFPEDGLPSSLSKLRVKNCSKLLANRTNWNLQTLQALTHLTIGDENEGGMETFPEEGLLPTTLTHLCIDGLPCLKSLDVKGLQQLTCLKGLIIYSCPLLLKLPEQRLPTSLVSLRICGCHILKERCQRDKGEDWNKISHISRIEI
ncbi:hypothetical protein FNV43_RR27197 [Rhamnella rubrinervis]|uniref:Disease resistance RPP13-like protein 1 n=1 Tax=Rhamnella rubrinervis TaxID=2594499 RepID=A0A8K0DWG2_9ROSA|nr:hypothetical protein FNV43_RR27197 [Rhamnella rubrinervis]